MAHQIITFDIREATPPQLEYALIQNDYGLNETIKNLIRNNLNQPDDQRIEYMHICNNVVFPRCRTNPFVRLRQIASSGHYTLKPKTKKLQTKKL